LEAGHCLLYYACSLPCCVRTRLTASRNDMQYSSSFKFTSVSRSPFGNRSARAPLWSYTIAGATAATITTTTTTTTTTTFQGSRIRLKKLVAHYFVTKMGRDVVVGTATRYGLDCPGIESRWVRDFPHLSKPTPGPTQPPTQWVPGVSRG